jgi:hypothetical protein
MWAAKMQIITIPHLTSSSKIVDVYVILSWWLAYVRGLPVLLPLLVKSPFGGRGGMPGASLRCVVIVVVVVVIIIGRCLHHCRRHPMGG